MFKYLILPATVMVAACGGADNDGASGTFEDGEGNVGSYLVSGDEQNGETVIKSDQGEVRIVTGDEAVKSLPMGISLYPGAEVQPSMAGMAEGRSGAMVVLKTADSADEVIDFYRNQLKSGEIEVKTDVNAGDTRVLAGERSDGEAVHISTTKAPDGGVMVSIIAGGKKQ